MAGREHGTHRAGFTSRDTGGAGSRPNPRKEHLVRNIIYIIGLIVVIVAVLSVLGLA